ncbi:hypothetical protein DPMN_088906 [Dreissena polymorpha]|uniref:Uncharacterized protein n=1 Tax=Dreissena polymorpha TaxID=45954 RepID=A0A9D4KVU6_DREPO|nr:hypothetical protein DPMN_088906 [Dreissena polymorpha]
MFYYSHIWKNAPPPGSHVFQPTGIIFELVQDIIKINLLTQFYEDRTINVASRVKKCPAPWQPCFSSNHIIETNLLTKFHEDWTINVLTRELSFFNRLFTCFHYIHIEKTAPLPGGHVFPPIMTIFELAKNVTSRVFTCFFHYIIIRKITPPPCGHFTCFHYIHIEKTAPPPGGHVFSPIWTICELFHDDWAKIVTSRVFTRNTAPPPGGHIFQRTGTLFQLNQHIIKTNILTHFELSRGINGTNVLTKFHEDRTINVASGVFTRQMLTPHDAQRTTHVGQKAITKAHHEHSSGELKIIR